jgi:hypothetical protein
MHVRGAAYGCGVARGREAALQDTLDLDARVLRHRWHGAGSCAGGGCFMVLWYRTQDYTRLDCEVHFVSAAADLLQ